MSESAPVEMSRVDTTELFGGISIAGLASLKDPKNPANEIITAKCSQDGCEEVYQIARFWAPLTSCDGCRTKAIKADQINRHQIYWESICPPLFRETSKTHADFPSKAYEATKNYLGEESLMLSGPTRAGKTRLGMMLLKRCLLRRNMKVNVLWPHVLKEVKSTKFPGQMLSKWAGYDLLLMDDALLSGAHDERVTDFLKDLLDERMKAKRCSIITSQIDGDDYEKAADKFGNITSADKSRIEALLARIKETFRIVPLKRILPPMPKREEEEAMF